MKSELILIPQIIVHPSSIILYDRPVWKGIKPVRQKLSTGQFDQNGTLLTFKNSDRKAHGNVSIQAKRKMSKALDYLLTIATEKKVFERVSGKTVIFKVAFVTLTLTSKQIHPDSEIINKCLNSLLLELKKYYSVKHYLWRAEKQKNGNIHFHLVIDKFIPYYELRNRWNRIINKLGYVDRYQENMKEFYKSGFKVSNNKNDKRPEPLQYIAYQKALTSNFNCPNSTDIHSTRKINNLKKYLTKYMTKNENQNKENETGNSNDVQENEVETIARLSQTGRIWGCNHELSNIEGFQSEIDSEISDEITKLCKSGKVHIYRDTYYTVITVNFQDLKRLGSENLFYYFANYLLKKFDYSLQLKTA